VEKTMPINLTREKKIVRETFFLSKWGRFFSFAKHSYRSGEVLPSLILGTNVYLANIYKVPHGVKNRFQIFSTYGFIRRGIYRVSTFRGFCLLLKISQNFSDVFATI
jgi:hypothetical protein